jgi:methylated-DNA-protein-cysteine methyltransferase related protein
VRRETPATVSRKLIRRIIKAGVRPNELREERILSIPRGKVATHGQVASAAGYPLYHRAVARLLRTTPLESLPWQRVIGSSGYIKLRFEAAAEQRLRLELEGVKFRGSKVDVSAYCAVFFIFSMTSRGSVLHRYVAACRLSMHEKGKKRAN